jgi:ankyrin repeat protein
MVAARLLDKGAELERSDRFCQTVLHVAAQNGEKELVEFLRKRGANPQARNILWETPGDIAPTDEIRDLLLAKKPETSP